MIWSGIGPTDHFIWFLEVVPAIIAREVLLCNQGVNGRGWLNLVIISIALAFSAFYELIEWWVAVATGTGAEAFLGTQGYVWDTQSDMAVAFYYRGVFIVAYSRSPVIGNHKARIVKLILVE